MMNNSIFIFSHQDDEFGVYELIRSLVLNNNNVIIIYLTSGQIYNKIPKNRVFKRDKESLRVLSLMGIKKKNIIFLGRKKNIPTCLLYKKLDLAYIHLKKIIKNLKGSVQIITHAWEGGNEDHDSCYAIVKKIISNSKNVSSAFQFPLYNSFNKSFFYSVQAPLKTNGKLLKVKSKFSNRLKFIMYLFFYKSQLKVWIGLYPFLIFNYLFRDFVYLQRIDKKYTIKKPHKGLLLYERFRNLEFNIVKKYIVKFYNS